MKIEVEVRSFISAKKYRELDEFFMNQGVFLGEDIQETIYFSAPVDLRVQKNKTGTKVWVKQGAMHDESREELEIWCQMQDYSTLLTLFEWLGFRRVVGWWRKRKSFQWQGVLVALDYTKKYGHILELEKSVTRHQDLALAKIQSLFNDLKISPTPKKEFEKRYKDYIREWQRGHNKA
jgi:predicted adenylyl cyclase CyaB